MSTDLRTFDDVRRVVLEVVHELAKNRRGISTNAVTDIARERLGPRDARVELAILTY